MAGARLDRLDRRAVAVRAAVAFAAAGALVTLAQRFDRLAELPGATGGALFALAFVCGAIAWPLGSGGAVAGTERAKLDVRPDGTFTWRPAGEGAHAWGGAFATRGLWDAPADPRRSEVRLRFELPDETPPRLLRSALQRGVRAARRVDGPDKVRARGEWRDVDGPTSHANVRLTLEGRRLDGPSARVASEAFAEAFLGRLERAGLEAWQRR